MAETTAATLSEPEREQVYRKNFIWFLADNILFSVALGIIGATTLVPDFVRRLTDSEILIGLSSTLFTIGYTLPQLFVARFIVRYARKKWWFVGPNIPFRLMILICAGIIFWVGDGRPEILLAGFFITYSIAAFGDGLVGVPWADLAATSLNHRWRARMFGIAAAVSGLLLVLAAPLIGLVLGENGPGFPNNYAVLFAISGGLLALSTLPGVFIRELPGAKAVEKPPSLAKYLPDLGRVLVKDGPFRAFILLRVLTNLFMMAAPFYIGFATVDLGLSSEVAVPVLLAMLTIGSVGGAMVYTWLGARNNLLYMRLAMLSAVLLPISAMLASVVGPGLLYFGFLISGLASPGNLLSCHMNWVVAYADADQRPAYVGLSNTVSALISLVSPLIGGMLAQQLGYQPLFGVSLVLALGALYVAVRYLRDRPAAEAAGGAAAVV